MIRALRQFEHLAITISEATPLYELAELMLLTDRGYLEQRKREAPPAGRHGFENWRRPKRKGRRKESSSR
jgi:hypothetical protein